jgi:hypothetical protein
MAASRCVPHINGFIAPFLPEVDGESAMMVVDEGKESVELVLQLGSMGLVVLPAERSPQHDSALTDGPALKDHPRLNVC